MFELVVQKLSLAPRLRHPAPDSEHGVWPKNWNWTIIGIPTRPTRRAEKSLEESLKKALGSYKGESKAKATLYYCSINKIDPLQRSFENINKPLPWETQIQK